MRGALFPRGPVTPRREVLAAIGPAFEREMIRASRAAARAVARWALSVFHARARIADAGSSAWGSDRRRSGAGSERLLGVRIVASPMAPLQYRFELRRGDEVVATGHVTRDEPIEIGDRVIVGGREGIARNIEPILGELELRLVVQLVRDEA